MKIVYTILFFIDTLALILLCYFLLKLMDHGVDSHKLTFSLLTSGILTSIALLVFFLNRYTKTKSAEGHDTKF